MNNDRISVRDIPAWRHLLLVCVVATLLPVTAALGTDEKSTTANTAIEHNGMGTINGIVVDEQGNRIPMAEIKIEKTQLAVSTDRQGNYSIINIPPRVYSVVCKRAGYKDSKALIVIIDANTVTTLNFTMSKEIPYFILGGPPPRHGWWLGE